MEAAPSSIHRSRLAFATLGHFVNDCYSAFLAPILPLLIAKFSLSLTAASSLAAIPSITSSVFQPLYGMASDRLQGRFFILLGPALSVVCMSLLGVAPNAAILGFLLLCAGIGSAAFHPQAVAAAGAASGTRKGFGISVFIFGGSLGFAVGPLAIILAVHLWGLDHSYYIIVPGLISVLLMLHYLQIPHKKVARSGLGSLRLAFQGAFKPMTALFGVAVLREFTRLAVVTFLPIFFTMRGWSLLESGTTLTLFSLAGALGGMVGGSLSDTWSRKGIIVASGLLCVPLLYGVFHTQGWLSFVLLALAAATLSGSNSVVVAFAQELVPSRAGTASSLVMGLGWGVAGVMLIAFGKLADVITVSRALDIAVMVPLLAVLLALTLPSDVAYDEMRSSGAPAVAGNR
jgi:FSR family fosmidomycin resistance protein-like MFS transporter